MIPYRKARHSASTVLSYAASYSALCALFFHSPLLTLIGADATTRAATEGYMFWTVYLGAAPAILNVGDGLSGAFRRLCAPCKHRDHERMPSEHYPGSGFHPSLGIQYGSRRRRTCHLSVQLCACFYFLILLYVRRGNTFVCINPKKFCFRRKHRFEICGVGIPASIQNLLM